MNNKKSIKDLKFNSAFIDILVVFTFFLSNRRALVFQDFYLKVPYTDQHLRIESLIWLVLVCWGVSALTRSQGWSIFFKHLKVNWFLFPFLIMAALSMLWTIHPSATFYRVIVLFLTTLIAGIYGIMVGRDRFLRLLAWFGVVLIIVSYLVIFLLPSVGTMIGHPYYGAWRGVFWHRNHLSIMMAILSIVILNEFIISIKKGWQYITFWGIAYITADLLIILSRSLTGFLLWLFLHFMLLVGAVWVKWRKKLRPFHYILLSFVILSIVVVGITNFDEISGIVNKSGSWAGRLNLWQYLLSKLVDKKPLFGHGYGAIWNFFEFKLMLADAVGWGMPILIGDNGYVDLLIHLGLVGLVLFLGALIVALYRFIQHAFVKKTFSSYFPVLLILFLLIANISFSLFLELETFFWLCIVTMLFNIQSIKKVL